MKVTLRWADGETVDLYDVHEVTKSWVGDEYLVVAKRRGGVEEQYTGQELGIKRAEEIDGQTQSVRTVRGTETNLQRESPNASIEEGDDEP